jgi:DNA-binding transcriptional ArsR family regulator
MRHVGGRTLVGVAACGIFLAACLFPQDPRTQTLVVPETIAFRILLGLKDVEPTSWDGKVTLSEGRVNAIQGWRFSDTDATDYTKSWTASTRYASPNMAQRRRGITRGAVTENGVIISASGVTASTRFDVETRQGNFSFTASALPFGEVRSFLKSGVLVDRVPASVQLTTSIEDQDFPSTAQTADEVLVAFVEFTHGDRTREIRGQLQQEPKDFEFLARPVGGDQVKLMRYSKTRRTWGVAESVSDRGQDCMRASVAVDGRKRTWVIWSANRNGNFDLFAKYNDRGKWSPIIRLTTDAGMDVNPVAATDTEGRVWVAWQGYRNGNLEVLATAQDDARFRPEQVVSFSQASDWDPSIAPAPNGGVAVAWDTYDKGDYDVYYRRLSFQSGIKLQDAVPVATSPGFEARSSIAFDPQNRLWVAYEVADVKWGKNFGTYDTTGVSLYQGRNIQVKCFEGEKAFVTADAAVPLLSLPALLPSPPNRKRNIPHTRSLPDPSLAKNRMPNQGASAGMQIRNAIPRLAIDPSGIVYLAYRNATGTRPGVGGIWRESILYFDGEKWRGPLIVPHSDGLLDVRAALVAQKSGELLLITASDHRETSRPVGELNADLYVAELVLGGAAKTAHLVEAPAEPPAQRMQSGDVEQATTTDSHGALRLLRGEINRYSEISAQGVNDGPLADAYRYFIDAAGLSWAGCCDRDVGPAREYAWWIDQKFADAYYLPGRFVTLFAYERSNRYPEGSREILFPIRGIRPLPHLPPVTTEDAAFPSRDTLMLYKYLKRFGGISIPHLSATDAGTDWRHTDADVEPVVSIYSGNRQSYEMPAAPRAVSENDCIGGRKPSGFVSNALNKGYRLGFTASSEHVSTHLAFTSLWVREATRQEVLEALRKRRVYASTSEIVADVRSGTHVMGEEFETGEPPSLTIRLSGTDELAKVEVIRDGRSVYVTEPKTRTVNLTWRDEAAVKGKTSYYYVRGEQADGQLVWVSPMWINYK